MLFQFKQFQVDQSGCAMKINTDGVLLGALVTSASAKTVLDIGAGTGVIAMMIAQRFPDAVIDAVEIDGAAAETAGKNFQGSPFANRLNMYATGFEQYFYSHPERKYDLILSNPPFYINALEAATDKKNLAKHTDRFFFDALVTSAAKQLTNDGEFWLVLPIPTAQLVKQLASQYQLFIKHVVTLHSFADSDAHREIIAFCLSETKTITQRFVIYDAPKVYSEQYRQALKDFFTIF